MKPRPHLWLRPLLLDEGEASFARRGFADTDAHKRARLETIGRTFIAGFNAAVVSGLSKALSDELETMDVERRGFAYEGAAMALALFDLLMPWSRCRVAAFAAGAGAAHVYMAHVGAGWALARLGRRPRRYLARLDPLLGSLALDGYGFHEGYFHQDRTVGAQLRPGSLSPIERRVFDQGLGRSLWFSQGARADAIAAVIGSFRADRQADLWSGVGLAAAYAGAGSDDELGELVERAGPHSEDLAQGAVFAAAARERAGNRAAHTTRACQLLARVGATHAAALAADARQGLPNADADRGYDRWRSNIRAALRREEMTCTAP